MLYLCELFVNGKLWEYAVFNTVNDCLDWVLPKGLIIAKEKNCSWDYTISDYAED